MAVDKKLASGKRFGSRYGRKTRHKFSRIESEHRKMHKCPYCSEIKVKRISVGIWECKKCDAKFTGKAYSVRKKVKAKEEEEFEELPVEQEVEEEKGEKYRETMPEPEESSEEETEEEPKED